MDHRFVRTTCPASGLSFLAGGTGLPVVLVHGLGWDGARLWAGQAAALADAGFRVIIPDLRGTGASPPLRTPVTTSDFAHDVSVLLQAQTVQSPALVGFSMGAMVVASLAASCDPRAVVLACGGLAATADGASVTETMLARAAGLGPVAFAEEQATAIFGTAYAAAHAEAVADFVRWRAAMDQISLHHAFRAPYGQDLRTVVQALTCPVHVIAADQDQFLRVADLAALSRELSAASFTVIHDAGHMAPVERPAAFNSALVSALKDA
jgi:pimeloyl-ACP methyl ester carboxylesterase